MAITRFEQDIDAPFGTGNFFDDTGKATYLSDPETASRFVTTMPGQKPRTQIASESTQIARNVMGAAAPQSGPDLRLASNAPGLPAGAAPPDAAAAARAAEEFGMPDLAPAAPPAGATPGPTTPAQAVVQKTAGMNAGLASRAPKPADLPIAGVSTTTSTTVQKGRDSALVDAQIDAEEKAGGALDEEIMSAGRDKDKRSDSVLEQRQVGLQGRIGRETANVFEAREKKRAADARVAQLREDLKRNDNSQDNERLVKNMSTGKKIGLVLLAAFNGAFGSLIGQKSNGVIDALDDAIDQDIERQKAEIASGKIRLGNEIADFMKQGYDAETAEALARDRLGAAVDNFHELTAQRQGIQGEHAAASQQIVAQRREARALRRSDLLAQKEDREQTTTNTTVTRAPLSSGAGASPDDLLKMGQLRQQELEAYEASEVAAAIGSTGPNGQPMTISNKRAKDAIEGAKDIAVKLPRYEVAEQQLQNVLTRLGVPPKAYDPETGVIDWSKVSDLKGVGPVDSRPALKAGPLAPVAAAAIEGGLVRTERQQVEDAQRALFESMVFATTGASATENQQINIGTQVGQVLSNEDSVRENLSGTAQQIALQKKAMLSGDSDASKLYRYNLNRGAVPSLRPGVN